MDKKSQYQSIQLPGFNFPDIQGTIDPRDICFKLDDPENRNYALNDLKDRITEHLELEPVKSSLWETLSSTEPGTGKCWAPLTVHTKDETGPGVPLLLLW